jgi:hypothetical protein
MPGPMERKPLLAYVAPGAAAQANPEPIVASLLDCDAPLGASRCKWRAVVVRCR